VPRSLTGRIVLVVVLPLVAAWLAMVLALGLVLTTLHADATKASLADVGQFVLVRFRAAAVDAELRAIVGEIREAVAGQGVAVQLLRADGSYTDLGEAPGIARPAGPIAIPADAVRGQTVSGATRFTDGDQYLYAATVLRPATGAGPRAIVLSRPDRSRALAIADLIRAFPLVLLVSGVVGIPLVLVLVRSVAGPLRRLATATADLPKGEHRPLPIEGPTEVGELTARFNAMAAELENARTRESALLADLRHDLRTPLTVIGGYATALADGTATGEDALRAARTIGEESARLERLVDELGAVERLRRGPDALRPEPIDADALLQSSVERFGAVAASAGITLAIVDPPADGGAGAPGAPRASRASGASPPPAVADALAFVADRSAIERVLANLINNALAATTAGGHVWLSVSAGPNETVILAVTDDGPGFPPGTATRAFERFYRADPARSGSGSGLGLAIVREIATAHGGTAHAENVAPRGARVSVVLPRIPPAG
jgi:signal transduction histidine kinase